MIAVYGYLDFVEYLLADFEQRKNRNRRYSFRAMAEKLNLSSSTVVRIMNGKRGISSSMVPRFIQYLKLDKDEAAYFSCMVTFKTARSEQTRMAAYREMILLRGCRTKTISEQQYAFYEKWYYAAIRELLRFCRFTGEYDKLAGLLIPPITESQARRSIEILRELGLIACEGSHYCVTNESISTGEIWGDAAIHTYQREVSQKAVEALENLTKKERDFSTMTMCYSSKGFAKVRELLKRTREELTRIEKTDTDPDTVYQVNFQFFPLSKQCGGDLCGRKKKKWKCTTDDIVTSHM